jgi:oligopeptide transport system substrate-binding protein
MAVMLDRTRLGRLSFTLMVSQQSLALLSIDGQLPIIRALAAVGAGLALSLAGCRPDETGFFGTTTPRHGPGELWINNAGEPEWLDPNKCADGNGGEILWNTFAGLVQAHPATLEPLPEIATHWDISADGRTYTFHLRPSEWSDGRPLTAHDFVYSFRRLVDPATASKYATNGHIFRGGAAISRGEAAPETLAARAIDDLTLEVTLENPIPYFLNFLTFYSFMPIPRHLLEDLATRGIDPELWIRPEHVVSNGPFRMTEWKFRQRMVFEKNPRYWDEANVRLERVRLAMVESYTTALNMYAAGEFDWPGSNTSLPAEFMDELARYRDFHRHPYLAVYYYWINTQAPPLDDPLVRRALSLAIDREALVSHVARGGQIPSASLVPDGLAGYRGLSLPLFDPERARQLLREAGYEQPEDLPPVTLMYNTSEGHKQVAEAIQQMWKKELGIRVELENQEWKVFLANAEQMNFQVCRMGWTGDYADPFTFLELLTTACGNNHSNWSSPEYDALLQAANRESDPATRLERLREAEALALAAQPLIPLYVYTRSQLIKPYVRGIEGNHQDRHPWKHIWIDEASPNTQGQPPARSAPSEPARKEAA